MFQDFHGLKMVKNPGPGANLMNILVAFLKLACVLIFSVAFLESYKKFKRLDFLPGAQKNLPALGHCISFYGYLVHKPLERVTNKRVDLGQTCVGAKALL